MMKMIRNECLKLWRQVAFRVVAIVVLCLSLVTPLLNWGLNAAMKWGSVDYGSLSHQIEESENSAEEYRSWGDEAEAVYYDAIADSKRFFLDNQLEESWKLDKFYTDVFKAEQIYNCYLYLATLTPGSDEYREAFWSSLWWSAEYDFVYRYFGWEVEKYEKQGSAYGEEPVIPSLYEQFMQEGGDYSSLTGVNWKAYAADAKSDLEKVKKDVLTMSPKSFYASYLDSFAVEIESIEGSIAMQKEAKGMLESNYQTIADKDSKEAQAARYDILSCEYSIERTEYQLEAKKLMNGELKKISDAEISPDEWHFDAICNTLSTVKQDAMSYLPMPEELYLLEYEDFFYDADDYEDYRKNCEKNLKQADDATEMILLGLAENLCPTELNPCATKNDFRNSIFEAVSYILIFMVVAGGTTIANEYSSGTIRLLVIRPKNRTKILASKLFALLFIGLGLIVIAVLLLLILEIILNGVGNLFDDDILFMFGEAVRLPAVAKTFAMIAASALTMLVYFSMALFLSVSMRKSPFAIILPLLLQMVLFPIVQNVAVILVEFWPWLAYTPVLYTDMSLLFGSPLGAYTVGLDIIGIITGSLSSMFYTEISTAGGGLWIGLLYHAFFAALFLFLSFLTFKKQQIKN